MDLGHLGFPCLYLLVVGVQAALYAAPYSNSLMLHLSLDGKLVNSPSGI